MRRPRTCGWVDLATGFPVAVSYETCERCIGMGITTEEAEKFRLSLVELTVNHVKKNGTARPQTQAAMAKRGVSVALRKRGVTVRHWPRWMGERYLNSWEGSPFPVELWRGVSAPFRRAWRDLKATWGGGSGTCGGCGCWKPAKDLFRLVVRRGRPYHEGCPTRRSPGSTTPPNPPSTRGRRASR